MSNNLLPESPLSIKHLKAFKKNIGIIKKSKNFSLEQLGVGSGKHKGIPKSSLSQLLNPKIMTSPSLTTVFTLIENINYLFNIHKESNDEWTQITISDIFDEDFSLKSTTKIVGAKTTTEGKMNLEEYYLIYYASSHEINGNISIHKGIIKIFSDNLEDIDSKIIEYNCIAIFDITFNENDSLEKIFNKESVKVNHMYKGSLKLINLRHLVFNLDSTGKNQFHHRTIILNYPQDLKHLYKGGAGIMTGTTTSGTSCPSYMEFVGFSSTIVKNPDNEIQDYLRLYSNPTYEIAEYDRIMLNMVQYFKHDENTLTSAVKGLTKTIINDSMKNIFLFKATEEYDHGWYDKFARGGSND